MTWEEIGAALMLPVFGLVWLNAVAWGVVGLLTAIGVIA